MFRRRKPRSPPARSTAIRCWAAWLRPTGIGVCLPTGCAVCAAATTLARPCASAPRLPWANPSSPRRGIWSWRSRSVSLRRTATCTACRSPTRARAARAGDWGAQAAEKTARAALAAIESEQDAAQQRYHAESMAFSSQQRRRHDLVFSHAVEAGGRGCGKAPSADRRRACRRRRAGGSGTGSAARCWRRAARRPAAPARRGGQTRRGAARAERGRGGIRAGPRAPAICRARGAGGGVRRAQLKGTAGRARASARVAGGAGRARRPAPATDFGAGKRSIGRRSRRRCSGSSRRAATRSRRWRRRAIVSSSWAPICGPPTKRGSPPSSDSSRRARRSRRCASRNRRPRSPSSSSGSNWPRRMPTWHRCPRS